MNRMHKVLAAGGLVALFSAALAWSLGGAGPPSETDFKANDAVETLTVKIDLGDGGDLEEPIALDLGLGFPLWLHPVGRKPGEDAPFGAVPQQTTAKTKVPAGASATFTFALKGEAGQDELQTTPHLLAGVRVADISRVGFASRGTTDWMLAGYEITISGKPFAAAQPGKKATELPEETRTKLADLEAKIKPLQAELAELRDLVKGELAKEADRKRLAEVEASLNALLAETAKLEGQGQVLVKAKAAQEAARSKLADLGLKVAPLQAELADLKALAKAELAAGADQERLAEVEASLAPLLAEQARLEGQLQGKYPWFEDPDFRSPWRDKPSVKSAKVTLVTRSHTGADTQNYVYFRTGGRKYLLGSPDVPLSDAAGPQEFSLDLLAGPLAAADLRGWAVGMLGQPGSFGKAPNRWHPQRILVEIDGRVVYDSEESDLDRRSLEAIRLIPPAHKDQDGQLVTNTPIARETFVWEAGKGAGLDPDKGTPLDLPGKDDSDYPKPEEGLPEEVPAEEDTTSDFPGEQELPWEEENWVDPSEVWPIPGCDPLPWGFPFQIESVRITAGWRTNDIFTVTWTVSGDESAIDHYHVALVQIRPHHPVPFGVIFPLTFSAPRGARWVSAPLAGVVADPRLFLAPVVVAIPVDPLTMTAHERIGPARAVFRAGTNAAAQLQFQAQWWRHPLAVPGWQVMPLAPGEPPGIGRAVWPAWQVEGHNAILFDLSTPGWNIGVRPQADDHIRLQLRAPGFAGKRRLVAHLGFLNGPGAINTTNVLMQCTLRNPVTDAQLHAYPAVVGHGDTAQPMQVLEQVFDAAHAGGAAFYVRVRLTFTGGAIDPLHPPALFGVRLVPEP